MLPSKIYRKAGVDTGTSVCFGGLATTPGLYACLRRPALIAEAKRTTIQMNC